MEALQILSYLLKVSIGVTIVWLLWQAFMRRENNFALSRLFILLGVALSVILPAIAPEISITSNSIISTQQEFYMVKLKEITVTAQNNGANIPWFLVGYGAISLFFAFRFNRRLASIVALYSKANKQRNGSWVIVNHQRDIPPFSFLNLCFINKKNIPNSSIQDVLDHEKAHFSKLHSLDIILFEILSVFQWFNPLFWQLKKRLIEVHEFQADEGVLRKRVDLYAYQESIVSLAFNGIALPIGNCFNKSLTLKRLAMMNLNEKRKGAVIRFSLSLMILGSLLFTIACEKAPETSELEEVVVTAKSEGAAEVQESPVDGEIFLVVEKMPKFDGGDANEFRKFIAQKVTYPKEAQKQSIQGRVYVQFIVTKTGSISNVKVVRGIAPSLDQAAVDVVKLSDGHWTPGYQRGEAVNVSYTFPIIFVLQ
ncbi:MAG: M56 family metallopeptidase [Tenuifilaceae bacterium]|jgi:TonB family protein|nr:M56 family metallopeptidase [Tenuifilaceae bacterium]